MTSMPPPPQARCCLVDSGRCQSPKNSIQDPDTVCNPCLTYHELYKIEEWSCAAPPVPNSPPFTGTPLPNPPITTLTTHARTTLLTEKAQLESSGPPKYLCANRDPIYERREWRTWCGKHKQGCLRSVDKRGKLCDNCWRANERAGNGLRLLMVFLGGSARVLAPDMV